MAKKNKLPKVINKGELEKKGTKELLSYLNRLRKLEERFELSDMDVNLDLADEETIYFKETDKWKTAYRDVKSILDNREHVKAWKTL